MKSFLSIFTLCLASFLAGQAFGQTPVAVQTDSLHQVTCLPGSVGSIFITVTAGEAPFTFAWSDGSTGEDLLDVPPGSYSLLVTGNDGETATLTETLEAALPTAVANAGGDLNCLNLTQLVSAAGSSSGPSISYLFSTVGGNITSPADAPEITVDAPGTYQLVVTDADNGCTASASATVLENVQTPDANAGPDQITPCSNDLVSLAGSSSTTGATAFWTASAGGNIQSGAATFSPVIDNPGTFILTVTDPTNGCSAVDLSLVTSNNEPPTASSAGGELICANLEVELSAIFDTLNATFSWAGPNGFSSLELNPIVVEAGDYPFSLTDTITGCTTVAVAVVTIDTVLPGAVAGGGGTLNCLISSLVLTGSSDQANVVFDWTGPNNFGSDQQNPTISAAGDYILTVIDTINGCQASDTILVLGNTQAPIADAGPDQITPCSNDLVSLAGSSSTAGATAFWTASAGGNIQSGAATFSPVIDNPGTFILTVTDPANGCTAVDLALVTSNNEPPTVSVSGGELICANLEVELSASFDTLNASFSWAGPGGFASLELNPTVNAAGNYLFSLTDTISGCATIATAVVTIDTIAPGAVAGGGGTLTCTNSSLLLTGSSASTNAVFDWTGPNNFGSDQQNPTVSTAGDYILTVVDTINGCQSSASISILENKTAPTADAGPDALLTCANPTATLDGSNSSTGGTVLYSWTTANGNLVSGQNGLAPTINQAGDYQLLVTDSANGCTASDAATVAADLAAPTVSATGGELNCLVNSVVLAGNFDPLAASASWSGPNNFSSIEQNPTANLAGDYLLTITKNSSGCTASATATISINQTAPDASATGGSITCFEPTVTIIAVSQTPNVIFEWTTAGGIFSTNDSVTVSQSGDYAVIVTNPANGCTATATAFVDDATTPPLVSAGPDGVLNCYLTTLVLNGSASQNDDAVYLWTTADGHISDLDDSLFPSVDAAGTYLLLVTDTLTGCSAIDSAVVVQTPAVAASISILENVKCPGGADGSAEVVASGGVGSFIFGWSNGSHEATAEFLIAGNYTVTVIDGEGCSAVAAVFILEPLPLLPNATATPESATNANDGTATSAPTGGTAPYTFEWSNFETTATITGLVPASWRVTVTDSRGCSAVEITNSRPFGCTLTGSITSENVSCNGQNDGTASVLIENASGPVGYLWNTLSTVSGISNLAPGNYQVLATDASGCEVHLITTISEPLQVMTAGQVFHNDVVCDDSGTGFIVGFANGGTQPYQFSWSNGGTQPEISGLNAGLFVLLATDANGCTAQFSTQILALDNEPPVLDLKNIVVQLNASGSVTIEATDFDEGSTDLDCGIVEWSISNSTFDCSQIGLQKVIITATDGNGNIAVDSAFVEIQDVQAPVLTCPDSRTVSFCHAIQVFDLPIIGDNCAAISANLTQAFGLASGAFFPVGTSVQVFNYIDGGGNLATCSFEITVVGEANLSASASDVACFGDCTGAIGLNIQGGFAPFSFAWNSGATTSEISSLCADDYEATITDNDGCTLTISTSIEQPDSLIINLLAVENPICTDSLEGSISVGTTGGTAPVSFAWSNGSTAQTEPNLAEGTYVIVATDGNGCTASATQMLLATDDEPPVAVVHDIVFLTLDANGQATLSTSQVDDGSYDNCAIGSMVLSQTEFDCDDIGSTIIKFTVFDKLANSSTAFVEVIIEDKLAPVLTCPNNIFVSFCHATVNYALPTVLENCQLAPGAAQLLAGLPSGSTFPIGSTTQTFGYTDAAGNQGQCFFNVEVIGQPTVVATASNAKCNGSCDGTATVVVTGGLPPFDYLWSNGQTTPTATNLCAGPVSVTVEDAGGCPLSFTVTVAQPTAISLITNQLADETDGNGNGLISISMAGGTAPFMFSWTKDGLPFATTEDLANLKAGLYVLTATDANGCFVVISFTISNIVATGEPAWATSFQLLPNPANEFVRLDFEQPMAEKVSVRFFDSAGKLVRSDIVKAIQNGDSMDVSSFPAGVWLVQIQAENGESIFRKLVITR